MNAGYANEFKAHRPNVEVVYDLFHVVMKYGREVVDRVRVHEATGLRKDKAGRKLIKSSRWLLLRNREIVKPEHRVRGDEFLAANRSLMKVYVLTDDLKHFRNFTDPGVAERFWKQWY